MSRPDISDKLIHFTRGRDEEEAYWNLCSIIQDRAIRGGNLRDLIKGGYNCVCFTETPLSALKLGFLDNLDRTRYQPFGVMYEKAHVFLQGGRPVIYQSDSEFYELPENKRWRHMRYEPVVIPPATNVIDFTWEREWRVQCESFEVRPSSAILVFPNRHWLRIFLETHETQLDLLVSEYSLVMEMDIAQQYGEMMRWGLVALDEAD